MKAMDDALNDALSNLVYDNYERGHRGYKNRLADVALIRAALSAQPAASAEPVAEVCIEPDYWSRGHFYEGRRKIVRPLRALLDLPVGTKLYAAPVAAQKADAARMPAKMPKHESYGDEYPSNDSYQEGVRRRVE